MTRLLTLLRRWLGVPDAADDWSACRWRTREPRPPVWLPKTLLAEDWKALLKEKS